MTSNSRRWNVLFGLDLLKRDRLDADQRAYTRSGDFRDKPGGRLAGWSTAVANWLSNPRAPQPFANCPDGSQLRPYSDFGSTCPARPAPSTPSRSRPAARRRAPAGVVERDLRFTTASKPSRCAVQPQQGRPDLQRAAHRGPWPACLHRPRHAYRRAGGAAGGHPNNPGSTPLPFEYTFFDLGPRLKDNTQVFYRALAGVRGSGERWDWKWRR